MLLSSTNSKIITLLLVTFLFFSKVESVSGKQYTYRETKATADNVSAILQQRGVRKGDMVAIICHNCPEFAFFLYGAMAVGATITLANPNYTSCMYIELVL